MDSLRRIAEGMEHDEGRYGHDENDKPKWFPHDARKCSKCRLLALCDQAEKTDLVQAINELCGVDIYWEQGQVSGAIQFPHAGEMVYRREVLNELATWLAARGIASSTRS